MKRTHHTFIVRIWTEPTTAAYLPPWRGLVEHVATRQKRYFTSLDGLNDFVSSLLDPAPELPDDSEQDPIERFDPSATPCHD